MAKLFGLYFVIFGAVSLFRQKSLMPAVRELIENRALVLILAVVELVAGLAVVLAYPQVSFEPAGIIGLIGWIMAIEAVVYLALPFSMVQRYVKKFNRMWWYRSGGVLAIALGAYLALAGFGLL